jgi:EAL and modified HD-GYP domain-containing signal transduction protein
VIGDELLFREATSHVIISAFTEFGLPELVGDRPSFVTSPREFLVGDLPVPFGYEQTILEVLKDGRG